MVSQIVRSPGVYYGKEIDLKTDLPLLTSTVIPYRGAWLEYETDTSEVFWVRIDKNRKLPITCLLRALGLRTNEEILEHFGDDPRIVVTLEKDPCKTYEEAMLEIYRKLRPGEPPTVEASETLHQQPLLRSPALRSVHRGPLQVQQEAGPVAPRGGPEAGLSRWQTPPPARSSSTRATC